MGVSKVDFAGETLVDLTGDTVNEQVLLSGYTAHGADGEPVEGNAIIPTKVSQLENDAGYAKTESPAFTGVPTAPTPPDNTNNTQIATTAYVKKLIANLVNGAPETLDTLKEIADALGENDDAVQALNAAIGNKVDKVAGKGLSTNDFTTAEKNKLAGIANNANNYSLPLASATVRGGAKVGYAKNGKNYPVELSNEQMFVNVPWTDTKYGTATQSANGLMTASDKKKLDGISEGANKTTSTTSLAVTQSGVSVLDGTVGKTLNDKGAQISVYVGDDGNLHFRNWDGADAVLPFSGLSGEMQVKSVTFGGVFATRIIPVNHKPKVLFQRCNALINAIDVYYNGEFIENSCVKSITDTGITLLSSWDATYTYTCYFV